MTNKKKAMFQKNIGVLFVILALLYIILKIVAVYSLYYLMNYPQTIQSAGDVPFGPYFIEILIHILGFILTSIYLSSILKGKVRAAGISFCFVIAYFFLLFIFGIFDLTPEERIRGLTIGLWLYNITVCFAKYAVVILLLANGYFGLLSLEELQEFKVS